MNEAELEQICRDEFGKIADFYSSEDKCVIKQIKYNEKNSLIYSASYYSSKLSDTNSNEGNTFIEFGIPEERALIGNINCMNVNPAFRKKGFDKEMVSAVEEIFRRTGKIAVYSKCISDPEFWKRLGYSLNEKGNEGINTL